VRLQVNCFKATADMSKPKEKRRDHRCGFLKNSKSVGLKKGRTVREISTIAG
jgi:hypothetical protein